MLSPNGHLNMYVNEQARNSDRIIEFPKIRGMKKTTHVSLNS